MQNEFHGALIGQSLGHSFSRRFFHAWFEQIQQPNFRYENWEFEQLDSFPNRLAAHPEYIGFNVTIPYKTQIISQLDHLDTDAREIGAVNTLVKTPEGKLIGYNTDWIGFRDSLLEVLEPQHTRALVFGTGGASKAILYALQQLGIDYTVVSRVQSQSSITYAELSSELAYSHTLWINTTPVGTAPNTSDLLDLPYEVLDSRFLLFDLIYNPEQTAFLAQGQQRGAKTVNGYEMLENQARAAWAIWQQYYPQLPLME